MKPTAHHANQEKIGFKTLYELAPVGIALTDLSANFVACNPAYVDLIGYSEEELAGLQISDILHPDDRAIYSDIIQRMLADETTGREAELRYTSNNGSMVWVRNALSVVPDDTGSPAQIMVVATDISRYKHTEAALLRTRNTLQEAQNIAHVGHFEHQLATGDLIWSDEVFRIFGIDPSSPAPTYAEVLDRFIHPDDLRSLNGTFNAAIRDRIAYKLEHRIVRPDAGVRWVYSQAEPHFKEDGTLLSYVGTTLDITERKSIEIALTESEQRWQFALEGAGDGLWDWNAETNKVYFSTQWKTMLGFAADEIGDTLAEWEQRVHPDDKPEVYVELDKLFARETAIYRSEHRVQCKDGGYKWILDRGKVISWREDGKPLRVIGSHSDISQRKEAEIELNAVRAALHQSEQRFRLAMSAADQGIWDWHVDSDQAYYSPGYATMLGYEPEQIPQNFAAWVDLLHPEDRDITVEKARDYVQAGDGHIEIEFRMRCRDGGYRWILSRGQVVERGDDNSPIRAIGTHVDISDLKQARQTAERLAKVKSEFLANMSHEIRTPLNAVLGFCQLLRNCPLEGESQMFVDKIDKSGRLLLSLINDILDFSRIESGQVEMERAPFSLNEVLDDLAVVMAAANQKNLELIILPTTEIDGLLGDRKCLQQVLTNLASNAIKFTERGEVEVRIATVSATDACATLRFKVRDSGVGIAEEKQREIFSAFTQADSSIGRRFGGSGLGLAISQQLVRLMGGEIRLESQIGQGSEFSFELTLGRHQAAMQSRPSLSCQHVIIISAKLNTRETLRTIVQCCGWRADVVDNYEAALDRVQDKSSQLEPHQVILLDWPMPGANAPEKVREIKESLATRFKKPINLPIVVLTTTGHHENLQKHPDYEWLDSVLIKPATPSGVCNTIGAALSRSKSKAAFRLQEPKTSTSRRLEGVRFLLADDNELNRDLIQRILKLEGALIHGVEHGLAAYEWLKAHPEAIDIVLMDVQMPVLDGYTATRLIRSDGRWQQLPIIALSAGALPEEQQKALAVGMNGFLAKPFSIDAMVTNLQQLSLQSSASREPIPQLEHLHAQSSTANAAPSNEIVHCNTIQDLLTTEDYATYLAMFVKNYGSASKTLTALGHRDPKETAALLHKLKGAAANLALTKISQAVADLEQAYEQGQDSADLIEALQQAMDETANTLYAEPPRLATTAQSTTDSMPTLVLVSNLLSAIDQGNLSLAESVLLSLRGRVPEAILEKIQAHLTLFDFQLAKRTTLTLFDSL